MSLTDKEIRKFQEIYRKNFGKEISREAVMDRGYKLARFVEIMVDTKLKMDREKKSKKT